jgi:hypothetical protein
MMTDADIERIENEIGLKLPSRYKAALLNHPRPTPILDHLELFSEADHVIDLNKRLRDEGFYGQDWPDHAIAVGEADGCVFFIYPTDDKCAVYYADYNEEFPPTEPWNSFDYLIELVSDREGVDKREALEWQAKWEKVLQIKSE